MDNLFSLNGTINLHGSNNIVFVNAVFNNSVINISCCRHQNAPAVAIMDVPVVAPVVAPVDALDQQVPPVPRGAAADQDPAAQVVNIVQVPAVQVVDIVQVPAAQVAEAEQIDESERVQGPIPPQALGTIIAPVPLDLNGYQSIQELVHYLEQFSTKIDGVLCSWRTYLGHPDIDVVVGVHLDEFRPRVTENNVAPVMNDVAPDAGDVVVHVPVVWQGPWSIYDLIQHYAALKQKNEEDLQQLTEKLVNFGANARVRVYTREFRQHLVVNAPVDAPINVPAPVDVPVAVDALVVVDVPVVVNVPVVANDGAVVAAENNELLFNVLGETVIANTIKK